MFPFLNLYNDIVIGMKLELAHTERFATAAGLEYAGFLISGNLL
jgi:hypothetical protein